MRRLATLISSAALLLLTPGCDSSPSPSPPDDTTLEPGSAVETEAGVRVIAPQGGLNQPVPVSGQEASVPATETPLPENATAAGPFYRIGGGRNVDLGREDAPLYYGLPVEEGANTDQLALGVRMPRAYATDDTASTSEYAWSVLPGAYEPERGLLVVPARFLTEEGTVLAALEGKSYNAPSMAGTSGETLLEKTKNFFSSDEDNTQRKAKMPGAKSSPSFEIKCVGFDSSDDCGSDEKSDVRSYLQTAYNDFVGGFKEPALATQLFTDRLTWKIKEKGDLWCEDAAGKYLFLTEIAITCYDGNGDPSESTTRHEFFHAVQFSYSRISWNRPKTKRPDWLVEGTAEIAESSRSDAETAYRKYGDKLRRVTRRLNKQGGKPHYPEYRVQDFWVYLINSRGSTPLETLEPLFQFDSDTPSVLDKVDQLYNLPNTYWRWARNQVIESSVSKRNPRLSPNCIFDSSAVKGQPEPLSYDIYGEGGTPKTRTVTVGPLKTKVYGVTLVNNSSQQKGLGEAGASTDAQGAFVEAYLTWDSPTTKCTEERNLDDGGYTSTGYVIDPGSTRVVYVLLSNGTKKEASFEVFADDDSLFSSQGTRQSRPKGHLRGRRARSLQRNVQLSREPVSGVRAGRRPDAILNRRRETSSQ